MDQFGMIKCNTCAAPMYPDFEKGGFSCKYCGSFVSWGDEFPAGRSHFAPLHVPPIMLDGAYDISSFCSSIREIDRPKVDEEHSTYGYSDKPISEQERAYDATAWKKWDNREVISTLCANCGADMNGLSTQNLFDCKYCGSTITVEALMGSSFEKEHIVGNNVIPAFAVPFRLSLDEARASILRLLEENPKELGKHHVAERLKDLKPVYLPYEVSDIHSLTKVDTHKGILFLFQERINHPTPLSFLYVPRLANNLGPWDFSHTVPFRPSYLSDEVMLVGMEKNDPLMVQSVRVRQQFDAAYDYLKTVGLYEESECHWVREHIRSSFQLMLPFFFLSEEKEGGVPFAVNGQTGLANALLDFYKTDSRITTKTDSGLYPMSDEAMLISPMLPIIKAPAGQELFVPAPLEQAMYKHTSEDRKRRSNKKMQMLFNKRKYYRNYLANREKELAAIPKD